MKKDKKFLEELEKYLSNISKTNRDRIISKYENIIKDEKAKKRKITDILKELGTPQSVAEKELQSVKESFFMKMRNNVKNSNIKKKPNAKKKEVKRPEKKKEEDKKIDNKKVDEVKKEEKIEKAEVKETKKEEVKESKKEEKNKVEKEEKKEKKVKLLDKLKAKKESKPKKEKPVKEKKEKTKLTSLFKKKKVTKNEEDEALELVEKLELKEKKKQEKFENKTKKSAKDVVKSVGSFLTKDITPKRNKKDKEEVEVKVEEEKKPKYKFKRHDKNELVEVVEPRESVSDIIEDIHDDIKEEFEDVNEIVAERHIYETRGQRATRILFKTLGLIVVTLLLFVWLWVAVVFFAAIFAYLDGVKFLGLNVMLLGLLVLLLTVIISINRGIFRKKHRVTLGLIFIIASVTTMSFGIALMLKQVSEIETVKDVTIKYTITNKMSTHEFSDNTSKKYVLTFNSNYNTQYTVEYDDSLENKFKMEVKYFECYYDYYMKQSSNQAYVSLKLDPRDRLSVYIDDLKEGKVFDNDELSRYSVKIIMNPRDVDRLVINN